MKKPTILAILVALILMFFWTPIRYAAHAVSAHVGGMPSPQTNGAQPVIRFVRNPQLVAPFLALDLDGNVVTPANWPGKVTVVVFWATWCPPCRAEIPELIRLQQQYPGRAQVIGVSVDEEPPSEVKQFSEKAGINYPVVMATQDISRGFGGVPALPTTFMVDQKTGVVQKHVGLHSYEELNTEVRALLGMSVDATVETFVDTGQVFLKNAANATDLPDVDLSGLTPRQRAIALKRLNSEGCTCGCQLTLAECRINDTACGVSKKIAADVVHQVRENQQPAAPPPSRTAPVTSLVTTVNGKS
jgi:thiol-disulfide isomerase/thioredoxin